MAKAALLIGVSNYQKGLSSLPAAIQDVKELKRVLKDPEMGNFDEVETLTDVNAQTIREAAERIFSQRKREDLVLFFFSGHGIKDEYGKLYLAAPETYKDQRGELVRSSAVATSSIQENMNRSRSKRQIVILDCCFSGAFGDNLAPKSDDLVDIERELGGEGRAILTSSTSSQYSFEQQGADLSIYTRYLIEGIETGAADQDDNGIISTDELHDYVKRKVQAAAPAMKPKIFVAEEGFKISLAQAPAQEPNLQYRREVERVARNGQGEISAVARKLLQHRQQALMISGAQAAAIEAEVFEPYRQYQQSLKTYEEALRSVLLPYNPITPRQQAELDRFQEILGLQDDDTKAIKAQIAAENEAIQFGKPQGLLQIKSSTPAVADNKATGASRTNNSELCYAEDQVVEDSAVQHTILSDDISAQQVAGKLAFESTSPSLLFKILGGLALLIAGGTVIMSLRPDAVLNGETTTALRIAPLDYQIIEDGHSQFSEQISTLLQANSDNFASQTLDIAWAYYEEGELQKAFDALNEISSESNLFQDAQSRIELWSKDWRENEAKRQQSETALADGNLDYARQQANSIKTPTTYWRNLQADLIARINAVPKIQPPVVTENVITPPTSGMSEEDCKTLRLDYGEGDTDAWYEVDSDGSKVRSWCKDYGIDFPG